MKNSILKRSFSCFLAIVMLVVMLPTTVMAAETNKTASADTTTTPTVEIVSFLRGSQEDLRSSELLEARVTGYDGNVQDLTYEWTNGLGTYLYVYNSHNMYNIENTDGEIEIYNSDKSVSSSTNMSGRSHDKTFFGTGYCWAAVYGANVTSWNNDLEGTISVTVKDKDGNLIGSDSHTGESKIQSESTFPFFSYSYTGFIPYNLDEDMDDVTIGLFVGDKENVKNLLGESAIVHITCVASTVNEAEITSGGDYITLTSDDSGNYYIEGTQAGTSTTTGDAIIELSVEKDNCKFHYESSGSSTTTVFVFKKPTTSTTTTTLTLAADSLDSRCSYFINGVEGTKQSDGSIIFTGLTPNTEYTVEVRGKYTDNGTTKYAYAYVTDTTLPVYTGTVEVYLNGTYDTSTATATGTLVNIEDMINNDGKLYVKKVGGTEFVTLEPTSTGTYSATVDNGTYYLYSAPNDDSRIDEQVLVMENANRTRYLFFNSVTYKDGDTTLGDVEYYVTGSSVDVRSEIPTKDDYIFTGWKEGDNTYQPSADLTEQIGRAHTLTAQWADATDVYVNITLNHKAENGEVDSDGGKYNISYDLMQRAGSTGDYTDIASKTITWDGTANTAVDGYTCTYDESTNVTKYEANTPVLTNQLADMEYTLETAKSGYSIESVEQTTDADGNIVINAELIYNPNDFDFTFNVELDDEAKTLPTNYKPTAVNVKVTFWDDENSDWITIGHHQDTYVKVDIDANGKGTGTYPVWTAVGDDNSSLYTYRIEVVSYVLPDGTIMTANDVDSKHTDYLTDDERYNANIVVTNGQDPVADDTSTLTGAYYQNNAQQGTVKAVISISTHTVTFEPNGGTFSDNTTANKVVEKQIAIPDLTQYTPTRDGGYVFDGWYVVENDEMTDETVNSGDALYGDITLRAKWKAPLTVEGQVAISGTYKISGDNVTLYTIHEADRATSAVVLLQKFLPNGYTESIDTKTVNVTYANDDTVGLVGTGNYQFTQVPDDGSEYRILVLESNYSTVYQNEPESLTKAQNYTDESYNISSYNAELGTTDTTTATVNTFLHFDPADFDLHYEIDSTLIGEGFRPSTVDTLILYDDGEHGINPQNWAVISQMVQNGTYYGQDTTLTDGKGSNSYPVWTNTTDGQTLYDYALRLNTYTINSTEDTFNESTAPFKAVYNGTARYDATTDYGQTQLLTIRLQPKQFAVNFNMNFTETTEDYVTNMDNYNLGTGYATAHTWSYETDISNVQPQRAGYKFLGWYNNADGTGEPVTKIEASVAENVTLYAKWEKSLTVTFYNNNSNVVDDDNVFRTYYESGATLPEGDSNKTLTEENKINSFYDIPEFDYNTHNEYIFKGWYLDEANDNDSRPIDWNTVYSTDTNVYAHWIKVDKVAQDENDTKNLIGADGFYSEYDLIGVQIRDVVEDKIEHYGNADTGLRFCTVLSENVYGQINDLNSIDSNEAEYGYVLATKNNADTFAHDNDNYELEYKDSNVNGVDTTTSYRYIQNVKCSGVPDHFNGEDYRIYTAVVTYTGLEGEALDNAHNTELVARSYIRYYDANGLYRTYYNNYTGTNTYSGCSTSFSAIQALANANG